MNYPQDFIDAVKKEYPNWPELHNHLDRGNRFAGRYLDDSSSESISPGELLKADTGSKMLALKQKAITLENRKSLWAWWCKLNEEQRD